MAPSSLAAGRQRCFEASTEGARNVPTYRTAQGSPATAENQLGYVFASRGFHRGVRAWALNGVGEWGSSDHCRILMEVDA